MQFNNIRLETDRLIIREHVSEDASVIARFGDDEAFARFLSGGAITAASAEKFVAKTLEDQAKEKYRHAFDLGVVEKSSGDLIGGVHVQISDIPNRRGEIGYAIGPGYRSKGYASEATQQIIDFGFGNLMLFRLFAQCDCANEASIKVLEKVGMPREGCLRGYQRQNKNEWSDWYVFGMTYRDWEANKASQ